MSKADMELVCPLADRNPEVQEAGLLEVEVLGVELRLPQKFASQTLHQTYKVDSSQIRPTFWLVEQPPPWYCLLI